MQRWLWLVSGMLSCCAWGAPETTSRDGSVAGVVALLLEHQHYAPQRVDDELSRRWLAAYLESLDANHMIFLDADVAEFVKRYGTSLDDDIGKTRPRLDAATDIYARYETRMAERLTAARATLAGELRMDTDETWEPDREDAPWPATAAEADDLWRRLVIDQVLRGELLDQPRDEVVKRLTKRFDRLEDGTQDVERDDVLEIYLDALTRLFDPHTAYFKPATIDNFDIEVSNAVEGIGARLRYEDDYTIVDDVLAGGPASLDGRLQPGDRITAVAQGDEDFVDIVGMRLDHVVRLIRGKKGTPVRLMIIPVDEPNQSTTRTIALVRDEVLLTESDADMHVLEGADGKIGVIDLPSFYADMEAMSNGDGPWRGATADVSRLLDELKAQEVDGIILDLRDNGGGSLREAVQMAGLFLDKGPVVQVRSGEGRVEVLDDEDAGAAWSGPLLVLTSPLSASASEIVAGAIQDDGRGLIVGAETTHGKGSVQQVLDLDPLMERMYGKSPDGSRAGALKITTQLFYRVSGSSTQNKGVHSDIALPSPWEGLDVYESDLDNALPWHQIAATRYAPAGDLSGLIPELQRRSSTRVSGSEDFTELDALLDRRDEARARKVLSLNLEARRALQEPEEPELPGDEATDPDKEASEADALAHDFILQEAAAILRDQISLGG